MKKIISILALAAVLAVSVPAVALAQQPELESICDVSIVKEKGLDDCKMSAIKCSTVDPTPNSNYSYDANCGFCCMLNTVYKITNWFFYILILLVTVFIIYGGFVIVTASGDPEKAGKGKQVLTFAIMGLAIALLARVIPSVVRFVIGV